MVSWNRIDAELADTIEHHLSRRRQTSFGEEVRVLIAKVRQEPRRCRYCGMPCWGAVCSAHRDLTLLDPSHAPATCNATGAVRELQVGRADSPREEV